MGRVGFGPQVSVGSTVVALTQAEYDALAEKDADTVYVIKPA